MFDFEDRKIDQKTLCPQNDVLVAQVCRIQGGWRNECGDKGQLPLWPNSFHHSRASASGDRLPLHPMSKNNGSFCGCNLSAAPQCYDYGCAALV